MSNKKKNEFKCSICNELDMSLIMDFGKVALAGAFLKPNNFNKEKKFPLRLFFCNNCYTVQIVDKINPKILFQDYFYFSSSIKTLREHFKEYASEISSRLLNTSEAKIVEFGCNDGVLLKPLADQGIKTVIGVDPAKNVVSAINDDRIRIINDYFDEKTARVIISQYGKVDMILANNVYAHIADIQGTTRAIKNTLNDDGVFVFEVHYLEKIVNQMHYDFIYHEHLFYHSLVSLIEHFKRYQMTIFDIKFIPIHGGSIRFYVCNSNSFRAKKVTNAVKILEKEEKKNGYNKFTKFQKFSKDVEKSKKELITLLKNLKSKGFTIAGYGASGRANTIIQYCGLNENLVSYMIDDAPAKQGFFTPGSHLEIFPSSILVGKNPPDYVLVFAFSFFDEILKRNKDYINRGGRMILPIPEIKIYP